MIEIEVRGGNIEGAIRVLKKKFERFKVDLKRHEFHLSKSARRRLKDQTALKRLKRKERRLQWPLTG